jgi:dephospho-CoA kinase
MIIGITGRVGVGKSKATDIIQKYFGFVVVDLDVVGHGLLEKKDIKLKIIEVFSNDILDKNECVDRAKLAQIVFADVAKLVMLNSIIHPEIKKKVESLLVDYTNESRIAIAGALIEEVGLTSYCNKTLVIDAADAAIKMAVGKKKSARLKFQRSREEYLNRADYVVENSYDDDYYNGIVSVIKRLIKEQVGVHLVSAEVLDVDSEEKQMVSVVSGAKKAVLASYKSKIDAVKASCDQDHKPLILDVNPAFKTRKVLGVVGGMGPLATHYFLNMFPDDMPIKVFSNTQIPDRTEVLLSGDQSQVQKINKMLKDSCDVLAELGADIFVISCNTAYYFVDGIDSLVNMIEVTCEAVEKMSDKSNVLLLSTKGIAKAGVYQSIGAKFGLDIVLPNDDDIDAVMQAIYALKAGCLDGELIKACVDVVNAYIGLDRAGVVILGCTELPIIFSDPRIKKSLNSKITFIDPMQVLVDKLIKCTGVR